MDMMVLHVLIFEMASFADYLPFLLRKVLKTANSPVDRPVWRRGGKVKK